MTNSLREGEGGPVGSDLVTLDRSGEPWIGTFSGLGVVRVHADGAVDVEVDADSDHDAEETARRADALAHGWGEPLSLARRGYHCVNGAGLVPPSEGAGSLIATGAPHDVAMALLALVAEGWAVLGDRLVPTTWVDGSLMAHPRPSPVLASKRRATEAGLSGTEVRTGSDAVAVDVPRTDVGQLVRAVVTVRIRHGHDPVLDVLDGHERFAAATALMARGALRPSAADDSSPQEARRQAMADDLRLATTLPFARLSVSSGTLDADMGALTGWWRSMVGGGD